MRAAGQSAGRAVSADATTGQRQDGRQLAAHLHSVAVRLRMQRDVLNQTMNQLVGCSSAVGGR